jgi:hypothetical protein
MKLAQSTNLAVALHQPHGRPVCWVVPLLQRPVRRLVDRQEVACSSTGAVEAGIRGGSTGCLGASDARDPIRCSQKCNALVDLGHLLHGGIGDPPRVGGQEPQHCVPLGPAEHHVAE